MSEGWSYRLKYGERTIDLRSDKLTVGRSRRCDIAIDDPSVSRKHVFLTFHEGKIHLQDLGSSNGTFVNGERVTTDAELYDGDALRLGDAEVSVEIREGTFEGAADSLEGGSGMLQVSGSTVLPTGSSVAMLAPPLGELPGPPEAEAEPPPKDEPSPPRTPRKPPKPVFDAPAPRQRRARSVATPPGLLKLDDSLALTAKPDSEIETTELLPSLHEEIPEDTGPVRIARDLKVSAFVAPAGFWLRAAAFLVDAFWVAGFVWLAYGVAGGVGALVVAGLIALVWWLGWGLLGTTPGKSLVGLQVIRSPERTGIGLGRSALRLVGFVAGGLVLGIGFLAAAFSESGLALHDRLAGTRVIRRGR